MSDLRLAVPDHAILHQGHRMVISEANKEIDTIIILTVFGICMQIDVFRITNIPDIVDVQFTDQIAGSRID